MERIGFHPLVAEWFADTFEAPTPVQVAGWSEISSGRHTLVAAPTGSGKTLTAFLWSLNQLVEAAVAGQIEDRVHVVYVSPLKALGNDIEKNLQVPLAEICKRAERSGLPLPSIRVAVRSGDTPQSERELQVKRPPHILITTPESLYILLTAARSREVLRNASTVIVDEIHAVAGDKRGAHLALSLERLDRLCGRPLQRIGLSATQRPIEEVAHLLAGSPLGANRARHATDRSCAIVDVGHRRAIDLRVETLRDFELGPISGQEMRAAMFDRFVELIGQHRTTIVFVNTRRMVERVAHALSERLGKERVAAHHGSMSRELRLVAEQGLKSGAIPVVVATASLELGIDIGHVDLVIHMGAPRALATLLQRVGRSGHFLGAVPKGILFPLTRDELVQCAAAVRAVYAGELDCLTIPENPRDVLAQQIVATVASEEIGVEELWNLVRGAYPYRNLARGEFDSIVEMLAEGISTRRGRRSAHLHFDRVNAKLRARRGARVAAITSGGAIPDTADYDVIEDPQNNFVGKVNEDFAIESLAGDIFLLGNKSWKIQRVEAGRIRVIDAAGAPPTIPFWLGEAPARTKELSAAVADLRGEVANRRGDGIAAVQWLMDECHVDQNGAEQIASYISETVAALGTVPTLDTLVAERFFDEAGGMQLVLHTPFGGRVNRALGLALRKRFCLSFNFELQAAATDDGVVISLVEQHSFPLDTVFSMVRSHTFLDDLIQAVLAAPMFTNRWRWNLTRALVLLRFRGGRKVPMQIQRMRAEDIMAAVFPEQLACQDNRTGPIQVPDHPLVRETIENCLHEAMDAEGLREVLEGIESGQVRTLAVETPAPSPMSHEILNANPYAFLDDAPLEERRARAVALRRTDVDLATGVGALDPAAIAEVCRQAWPLPRDAEEVHDALLTLCVLPQADAEPWLDLLAKLIADRRATRMLLPAVPAPHFVAAERLTHARLAYPDSRFDPPISAVEVAGRRVNDEAAAVLEIVRGWMECVGPITAPALAKRLALPTPRVEAAMARLESEGVVLRGSFSYGPGSQHPAFVAGPAEWCERGLLARIHRLTIGRLRKEIEPVSAADFMRFLFRWQHVAQGFQLHGKHGVRKVIAQLQGMELPALAWERDVLPARVVRYEPADLEQLCLAGEIAWGRLGITVRRDEPDQRSAHNRRRQVPARSAPLAFFLRENMHELLAPLPEDARWREELTPNAREVLDYLERRGASFLGDIARNLKRLPVEVENALWELVASGLITGDGVAGLRTLLLPDKDRKTRRTARAIPRYLRSLPGTGARRLMPVGRWSLLRGRETGTECQELDATEAAARRLLGRYGVVFRELCVRERFMPAWRQVLMSLRRMEARGELRGGRFVDGFAAEQFALVEAVEALRAVRRCGNPDEIVVISTADPLNLVGIVTPGGRVSPYSGQVIAYRGGVPIEIGELGTVLSRIQRLG